MLRSPLWIVIGIVLFCGDSLKAIELPQGLSTANLGAKSDTKRALATKVEPTSSYTPIEIEGWPVLVSAELVAQPKLRQQLEDQITYDLMRIKRALPPAALKRIQHVPIWLELHNANPAQFHWDAAWLLDNGYNPDKAGAVEISNTRGYLRRPSYDLTNTLLHELAHAYHYYALGGKQNLEIQRAHARAVASGKYDEVLRSNGHCQRHYALASPSEFFAESTEAYFAVNDYFPFVRAELEKFDPATAELLERLWNQPETADPHETPGPLAESE